MRYLPRGVRDHPAYLGARSPYVAAPTVPAGRLSRAAGGTGLTTGDQLCILAAKMIFTSPTARTDAPERPFGAVDLLTLVLEAIRPSLGFDLAVAVLCEDGRHVVPEYAAGHARACRRRGRTRPGAGRLRRAGRHRPRDLAERGPACDHARRRARRRHRRAGGVRGRAARRRRRRHRHVAHQLRDADDQGAARPLLRDGRRTSRKRSSGSMRSARRRSWRRSDCCSPRRCPASASSFPAWRTS